MEGIVTFFGSSSSSNFGHLGKVYHREAQRSCPRVATISWMRLVPDHTYSSRTAIVRESKPPRAFEKDKNSLHRHNTTNLSQTKTCARGSLAWLQLALGHGEYRNSICCQRDRNGSQNLNNHRAR